MILRLGFFSFAFRGLLYDVQRFCFFHLCFLGNNAGSDFALWFLFLGISMSWFKKDRVCFVKNGFGFFLFFLGAIFHRHFSFILVYLTKWEKSMELSCLWVLG